MPTGMEGQREAMRAAGAAGAFDEFLIRRSSAAIAVLTDRFDQRHRCAARAAAAAETDATRILLPARHVQHQVEAESAARRQHARDGAERFRQVALAHQRLQDAVRRNHQIESATTDRRRRPARASDAASTRRGHHS